MAEKKFKEETPNLGPSRGMFISLIIVIVVVVGGGFYLWKSMKNTTPLSPTPTSIPTFTVDTQPASTSAEAIVATSYVCADDKTIQASFNNSNDGSVEISLSDGRKANLPRHPSGSGAKYANADESFIFFTQENNAFIEENGSKTYLDCVASI